jgi:membrane protein DedA with SNARE-associated domain
MELALLKLSLAMGSISDTAANWVVKVVHDIGLPGIFLLMTAESALIPFPSEPTMLAAGVETSRGELNFVAVVVVGTLANVVGSLIGYAIGYYGRLETVERHKWLHVDAKQLARVENWFEKYGPITVFFSRLLPLVRTFVSIPAGAAKMALPKFVAYTFAGCFLWMLVLTWAGRKAGDNWHQLESKFHYFDYVIVLAIIVAAAWLVLRWWRGRTPKDPQPAA